MHPLHDYIAGQLAQELTTRNVLVWYDAGKDFAPFIAELRGSPRTSGQPVLVSVAGVATQLAEYAGSMYELRAVVESFVSGDTPERVLIYLPGCERDTQGSVLMELEKAGITYQRTLKWLATQVLRRKYTEGIIDELLTPEHVTYEDLARASSDSSDSHPPSILKGIFHDTGGNDSLLSTWLMSDEHDEEIVEKEATRELIKLVRSNLGLELQDDSALGKIRAITLRYVLVGEFRSDLSSAPPSCLDGVPTPRTQEEVSALRETARRLRSRFADSYATAAEQIEEELRLRNAKVPATALGSVDTFKFEERVLLNHCGDLIAATKFDEALTIIKARERSFWVDRDIGRKAQWEAVRRMADLGSIALSVQASAIKFTGNSKAWIEAYTTTGGWYRLDQAQRRLEAWIASSALDEEPEERALGIVRRTYEDACQTTAEGFIEAFKSAGWAAAHSLHQTSVFSEIVSAQPKPVAYFLVDAMRFEMGVEFAERLPSSSEVLVRYAVGALPSITPIGMAALQPGASGSFSVVAQDGKLGARINGAFLPDLPSRKRFAAAQVPRLADIGLDELLALQPSKLAKKVDGIQVLIVRSQEIDHAGEAGFTFQARRVMDTVIDNLSRAIRKLAGAGIEYAVISADHGHLFASDRDESMRIDAPGGETVDLHRRCWIGHGGTTPAGCVRVTAAELGYGSDLEFVFPKGCAVFKAGGDLAFHHGGPSLQELIIPVLTIRTKVRDPARASIGAVSVTGLPDVVTNRIFSVTLQGDLLSGDQMVLPLLMSGGRQVGRVGMAVDAELDRVTGCVRLVANKPVTVAFLLSDESVTSLRVILQDPSNDAELYRSPAEIPIRLGT
jgi:hypothetical protein